MRSYRLRHGVDTRGTEKGANTGSETFEARYQVQAQERETLKAGSMPQVGGPLSRSLGQTIVVPDGVPLRLLTHSLFRV